MVDAKTQQVEGRKGAAGAKAMPYDIGNAEISLRERVKELTCLYQLGEVIERCEDSSDPFDVLFQGAADILPESWLHSGIAQARIVFDGKEYVTAGFQESSWMMAADLVVTGRKVGVVEVQYLEERPTVDEGPFLTEERNLITAVAERLGRVVERIQAEQTVRIEQLALRHKNIAMGEILNKIQQEKKQIGRQVMANVDKIIMPVLDDLEQGLSERQRRVAAILRDSLHEITSPFVDRLSNCFEGLTPTQVRVCNFVRRGMTSKEIAAIEHISPGTVRVHRFKIRRKLGLLNKNVNLQTFLQSAMPNVASE
jgi:DNA-binding CsgD family transcriptional regulator